MRKAKTVIVLFLIAAVLVLAGCNTAAPAASQGSDATQAAAQATPAVATPEAVATDNKGVDIVDGIDDSIEMDELDNIESDMDIVAG
ncbi:hypothetical protein HZB01_05215 [Candidatus Woesearchaeota archaeon]|nr:hypothetical protein [Candidatus Woesearchaeota archaeon]